MIKSISSILFNDFATKHELKTIFQTSKYGNSLIDTEHEYVGYFEDNNLVGAGLIIFNNISFKYKSAYSPKGFLLDYYDDSLIKKVFNGLKDYYFKKNVIYITINPEICIGMYDKGTKKCLQGENFYLQSFLTSSDCIKKENINYLIPVTNLNNFNDRLSKNIISSYESTRVLGLKIEKNSVEELYKVYDYIKSEDTKLSSITSFVNNFKENVDIFFIKLNYNVFLIKIRELLTDEEEKNSYYNKMLQINNTEENLQKKMDSDQLVIKYKRYLSIAIKHASDGIVNVGAVITVKYDKRVYLYNIGYDKTIDYINIDNYIFIDLFNYYKNDYDYFTLVTEECSSNSKLLEYSTDIMQVIGKYDLVINDTHYYIFKNKKTIS